MSLAPKPFNRLQKIIKAIYRGKPNVFADVDLNRHFSIIEDSLRGLWRGTFADFSHNFVFEGDYNAPNDNLNYSISWQPFSVVYNGMAFDFPAGSVSGTTVGGNKPGLRLFIVAKKRLVTFSDNQELSGVTGPDLANPLAAADHLVYENHRLLAVEYPYNPVIAPDEELIVPIISIMPAFNPDNPAPKLYQLSLTGYTELAKQRLGNRFGDCSLVELNQYILDVLFNYSGDPVGTIRMYRRSLDNFDNTGLGFGSMAGWAICNGNNGTVDFRRAVPVGYDPEPITPNNPTGDNDIRYGSIGSSLGQNMRAITKQNLPAVPLKIKAIDGTNFYYDQGTTGNRWGLRHDKDNTGGTAGEMKTENLGNGDAFDLRQKSVVVAFIERIF